MLLHYHNSLHKTKHHLSNFHTKYNVSSITIGLLLALAIQMNILFYLGMLPIQTISPEDISLSFAGTTISTVLEVAKEIIFGS